MFSQTLHLFMIIQEKEAGSQVDKQRLKVEAEQICSFINMELKTYIYDSENETFMQAFQSLSVGNDDVIWYYYSGHGRNSGNGWPSFSNETFSFVLSDIHESLIKKNARLTISMYDCCNYGQTTQPWTATQQNEQAVSAKNLQLAYYLLFKNTKGNIMLCSADEAKLSYGNTALGGFFTHSFIENIRTLVIENQEIIWVNLLQKTKAYTNTMCENYAQTSQNPKFYTKIVTEKFEGDITEILAEPIILINRDFDNTTNKLQNLYNNLISE